MRELIVTKKKPSEPSETESRELNDGDLDQVSGGVFPSIVGWTDPEKPADGRGGSRDGSGG